MSSASVAARCAKRFHHLVLEITENTVLIRLGAQLLTMAYHLQATRVLRGSASNASLLSRIRRTVTV